MQIVRKLNRLEASKYGNSENGVEKTSDLSYCRKFVSMKCAFQYTFNSWRADRYLKFRDYNNVFYDLLIYSAYMCELSQKIYNYFSGLISGTGSVSIKS